MTDCVSTRPCLCSLVLAHCSLGLGAKKAVKMSSELLQTVIISLFFVLLTLLPMFLHRYVSIPQNLTNFLFPLSPFFFHPFGFLGILLRSRPINSKHFVVPTNILCWSETRPNSYTLSKYVQHTLVLIGVKLSPSKTCLTRQIQHFFGDSCCHDLDISLTIRGASGFWSL